LRCLRFTMLDPVHGDADWVKSPGLRPMQAGERLFKPLSGRCRVFVVV
jgi:hypothetical protein